MINRLKGFLKENNLNWTGDIITYQDDNFREATEDDFKEKDIYNLLISCDDGFMCASIEIDIASFYIVGQLKTVDIKKNVGYKPENKKLLTPRDLSKEWINYQLNHSLVYATILRDYCKKNKERIEKKYQEKERLLKSKLEVLEKNKIESLKEFEQLENLI